MSAKAGAATKSAEIRSRLNYPVIDADGHLYEFTPLFMEMLAKVGGAGMPQKYRDYLAATGSYSGWWHDMSWDERRDLRARRPAWWAYPTASTRDAATAALPSLAHERLATGELGMDFVVSYGMTSIPVMLIRDEEIRRAAVRAINLTKAEQFREESDRITPVASIPMHTPGEAIAELEYAVRELGLKSIVIPTTVLRPIPAVHRAHPEVFPDACWLDTYGIDSEYDYDPFWAKCQELKVAVSAHSGTQPLLPMYGRSISNFSFNHIGNHAYHQGLLCKSIFMGGVTRRFPRLNFAFMEGGVGWAAVMLHEILGTWRKRSVSGLAATDPYRLDHAGYTALMKQYGGRLTSGRPESDLAPHPTIVKPMKPENFDEWEALGVASEEELIERFVGNFYFGVEADDPINAWAFNTRVNPCGVRLKAVLGSDIGHYDVPDMSRVVEEAYELLEHGLLDEADFRDLVFANAVRLHGGMNPAFYDGTAVEREARALLDKAEPVKA